MAVERVSGYATRSGKRVRSYTRRPTLHYATLPRSVAPRWVVTEHPAPGNMRVSEYPELGDALKHLGRRKYDVVGPAAKRRMRGRAREAAFAERGARLADRLLENLRDSPSTP